MKLTKLLPLLFLAACTTTPPVKLLTRSEIIESTAEYYDISPDLIRAVIQVESSNCKHLVSNRGALGCMQVTIPTAKTVCGISDPRLLLHEGLNIDCGTKILSELLHQRKDLIVALREYNGGYKCRKGGCKESENYWRKVIGQMG